jgi:hypothetical protein
MVVHGDPEGDRPRHAAAVDLTTPEARANFPECFARALAQKIHHL